MIRYLRYLRFIKLLSPTKNNIIIYNIETNLKIGHKLWSCQHIYCQLYIHIIISYNLRAQLWKVLFLFCRGFVMEIIIVLNLCNVSIKKKSINNVKVVLFICEQFELDTLHIIILYKLIFLMVNTHFPKVLTCYEIFVFTQF